MNLLDSSDESAFRRELRAWLAANLPGDADDGDYDELMGAEERFERQLAWHRQLYAGGWIGLHWPREYGGRGASLVEQFIFQDEMQRVRAPAPANVLGLLLVGPTLMRWGTDAQRRRFLPSILSADEIWCQGYSEPNAGSDLSALRTAARDCGDHFMINGQKIWTSMAHRAHWCILLARTDPSAPKHRGLSYFLVDMHTPGITVRPLRQMTGDAGFNEVFFTDVRVPRTQLVGAPNDGWRVAMTTLMFERAGMGTDLRYGALVQQVAALARRVTVGGVAARQHSLMRQRIGQCAIEAAIMRYNRLRNLSRWQRDAAPGAEGSIAKLTMSDLDVQLSALACDLLGPYAVLRRDDARVPDRGLWAQRFLSSPALPIAGGTSEVQRNIIAQRVLQLPRVEER